MLSQPKMTVATERADDVPTDEMLLAQARARSSAAFELLMRRLRPELSWRANERDRTPDHDLHAILFSTASRGAFWG